MMQISHPFDLAALLQKINRELDDHEVDASDIFFHVQARLKEHMPITLTCITAGGSNVPSFKDSAIEIEDYFLTLDEKHYTFRGVEALGDLKDHTCEEVLSLYMDERLDPGQTYVDVHYGIECPYPPSIYREALELVDHLIDQAVSEFQHVNLSDQTVAATPHRNRQRL